MSSPQWLKDIIYNEGRSEHDVIADAVWAEIERRVEAGHSPYVYLKQDVFDALGADA